MKIKFNWLTRIILSAVNVVHFLIFDFVISHFTDIIDYRFTIIGSLFVFTGSLFINELNLHICYKTASAEKKEKLICCGEAFKSRYGGNSYYLLLFENVLECSPNGKGARKIIKITTENLENVSIRNRNLVLQYNNEEIVFITGDSAKWAELISQTLSKPYIQ